MVHQQSDIMEVIRSISENRQKLQDLEFFATVQWGELYWLNAKFQNSETAMIMKAVSREIAYYNEEYKSSTFIHPN